MSAKLCYDAKKKNNDAKKKNNVTTIYGQTRQKNVAEIGTTHLLFQKYPLY